MILALVTHISIDKNKEHGPVYGHCSESWLKLSCDTHTHHTYIYKQDLDESTLAYLDHLQAVM